MLYNRYGYQYMNVDEPLTDITLSRKSNTDTSTNLVVTKAVTGESGTNTYYVGLFENETDTVSDKVYKIEAVDGVGSVVIDTKYDSTRGYYVYETDRYGNKKNMLSEPLIYSKNKVLDNVEATLGSTVSSDGNLVSSTSIFDTDVGAVPSGSSYYLDNVVSVKNKYLDTVTIKDNENLCIVTYEDEKGNIEEFVVNVGDKLELPVAFSKAGYTFDRWVAIVDGNEVEITDDFVVTSDLTLVAKYNKIDTDTDVSIYNEDLYDEKNAPATTKPVINTGDINILVFVSIFLIAIILIIVWYIVRNKTKEKIDENMNKSNSDNTKTEQK